MGLRSLLATKMKMTPTRNKIYLSVPGSAPKGSAHADVKIKRENMKLVSKTRQAVITETFEIELTAGNTVFVIDYLDENGKVIDTVFRDENGRDLSDDPGLFDAIIEFLEELEYGFDIVDHDVNE